MSNKILYIYLIVLSVITVATLLYVFYLRYKKSDEWFVFLSVVDVEVILIGLTLVGLNEGNINYIIGLGILVFIIVFLTFFGMFLRGTDSSYSEKKNDNRRDD